MINLPGILGTLADLLVVVIGFGLIVFVHELGHFIAARWAGIRVLTFAIGFGPALVSYRKGMGVRRGSSEAEYEQAQRAWREGIGKVDPNTLSPTEYRLSALPLGGYVRMLGQEDLNPDAVSDASDSYQNCKPWKRMIVISAGVVMNVVAAAALFIAVFMVGLQVEPPRIGTIAQGSPAASATAVAPTGERVGLEPGDTVISVDGEEPHRFDAVMMAVAMSDPSTPTRVVVQREGVGLLTFDIEPEASEATGLLDLGVGPAQTLTIETGLNDAERGLIRDALDRSPLRGVEPGMTLQSIDGDAATSVAQLVDAFKKSAGDPIELVFANDAARSSVTLHADPEFQLALAPLSTGGTAMHEHLLGLAGVMMVHPDAPADLVAQGLKPGDVFERIGAAEYPSLPRGMEAIRSNAGRTIEVVVRRTGADGSAERVTLNPRVSRQGRIGFPPSDTASTSNLVSLPIAALADIAGEDLPPPPAINVITRPGTRITSVNGTTTNTLADVREALRAATSDAPGGGATVTLGLTLPTPGNPDATATWELSADEVAELHELGWLTPFSTALFAPERMTLRAGGPVQAIGLGLEETKRVMAKTYLTFARLFQGSVKVEHLKGPVGIAHVGTRIASRGPVWLMFFMALISVNLAVINFLPLPIVDGGQFLMLLYEQFRGRPVPIPVQNAVTLAGLVLIGGVFLLVTFNDVRALFGI
ncbi:MAG: site-2 protease family protein [Phycisphaerales bacterium]